MGLLIKPFTLSFMRDSKSFTIGSDTMTSQNKASSVSLKRNVNGSKSLSFKMYYRYKDTITGEDRKNPYTDENSDANIRNEDTLYLHYKDKDYYFVVKNITKNSSDYSCTFSAEDKGVQELSKNGFNVVLDAELNNNVGSVTTLAAEALKDTNWEVDIDGSDKIFQTQNETLVLLEYGRNKPTDSFTQFSARPVSYDVNEKMVKLRSSEDFKIDYKTDVNQKTNNYILAFYSSLNGERRFQFIDAHECEFVRDGNSSSYSMKTLPSGVYKDDNDNLVDSNGEPCQQYICDEGVKPAYQFVGYVVNYKADRFVFSPEREYFAPLKIYADVVEKDGSKYLHYQKTTYESPSIVQNFAANTMFKSTDGWSGNYLGESGKKLTIINKEGNEVIAADPKVSISSNPDIYTTLKEGTLSKIDIEKPFTKFLKVKVNPVTLNELSQVLIEDGFYSNRSRIKSLTEGDKFIIAFKERIVKDSDEVDEELEKTRVKFVKAVTDIKIADYRHNNESSYYTILDINNNYFDIDKNENGINWQVDRESGFTYVVATCIKAVTETAMKKSHIRTFFYLRAEDIFFELEEFLLFRQIGDTIVFPSAETITDDTIKPIQTITHYYFKGEDNKLVETLEDLNYVSKKINDVDSSFKTSYTENAEKRRIVTIKESNYYNILQTLAESFECWLDIEYAINGPKKVRFKRYIGQQNDAGFRYGINLKDISRTVDSKAMVTKLIVKPNSNEFAPSGFCTIARAKANPIQDTILFDFSSYFHNGQMSAEKFRRDVYDSTGAKGADILGWQESDGTNLNGYYERISAINRKLQDVGEALGQLILPLTKSEAELQVATTGAEEVEELIKQSTEHLEQVSLILGIGTKELSATEQLKLEDKQFTKYIEELREYYANRKYYNDEVVRLTRLLDGYTDETGKYHEGYRDQKSRYEELRDNYLKQKIALNKAFYTEYAPYILEGTWIDEQYTDDDKYYLDAQATLNNSCLPQITYNINVVDVSQQSQYSKRQYDVGDQTFIQDPEYFGWNKTESGKVPRRQKVTISETVEIIDQLGKNSIKIQTFKNQFQDLFKKITATVQSVQYNEGSYKKAAELVEAEESYKMAFLEGALNSARMAIQNAGDQTVVWDRNGITVTDANNASKQLRIVSGAIMFRTLDENNEEVWKTGITPDGIAADYVTSGQLNTNAIQIMHKDYPMFRWDNKGITAYDFSFASDGVTIKSYDTTKFTRFDKFGLYGVNGQDGMTWETSSAKEALEESTFGLTWEGLKVKAKDNGTLLIGDAAKGEGVGDNSIMSVKNAAGATTFSISPDGTLLWTPQSTPTRTLYHQGQADGTAPVKPLDFGQEGFIEYGNYVNESSTEWHKVIGENDLYASWSNDGGNTWGNPIRVAGKQGENYSPYTLSLDDDATYVSSDFVSSTDFIAEITPTFKIGNGAQQTTTVTIDDIDDDELFIKVHSTEIDFKIEDGKAQIFGFKGNSLETGTLYFELKNKNGESYDIYSTATYKLIRREKGDTGGSGVSPYLLKLSKPSAVIFTAADGILNTNEEIKTLESVTNVIASVWQGTTEIKDIEFSWKITAGTTGNTDNKENDTISQEKGTSVYLTNMVSDTVVLTCTATQKEGTGEDAEVVWLDSITYNIVKQKQGIEGIAVVDCYIESSAGTLFEQNSTIETMLTARIFQGTTELDPNGTQYTYTWWAENAPTDEAIRDKNNQPITTKTITIVPKDYIGREIYFTAAKKEEQQQ